MKPVKKYKISRRLGAPIFEKCQTQKYTLRLQRRKDISYRNVSEYGKQLKEKQKLRYIYSINEKTLKNYVQKAIDIPGLSNSDALVMLLERRLDSLVYRMGLASTRRAARQMVSHGHITVNGRKVTIPSIHVRNQDEIGIREGKKKTALFVDLKEKRNNRSISNWITWDNSKLIGNIKSDPKPDEDLIDFSVVFEYYSR